MKFIKINTEDLYKEINELPKNTLISQFFQNMLLTKNLSQKEYHRKLIKDICEYDFDTRSVIYPPISA